MRFFAAILLLIVVCVGCGQRTEPRGQEPVRVSFLEDESTLDAMAKLLMSAGCQEDGVFCFVKAVKAYNSGRLQLDLSKFPDAIQGVFSFQSITQLVAALPHKLRDMPHGFELNCFDAVFLLTEGQLKSGLKPDDIFGVSISPKLNTNNEWILLPTATARDAFMWSCPLWYLSASNPFMPKSGSDSRMNVVAALYGYYVLPSSTSITNVVESVLQTLRANWTRQRITFPTTCEVVLCHELQADRRNLLTLHAGLLFKLDGGYTFVEKDSGAGPFVRLDFQVEDELLPWLASKFERRYGNRFFVTFNDGKIEELEVTVPLAVGIKTTSFESNQPAQPK